MGVAVALVPEAHQVEHLAGRVRGARACPTPRILRPKPTFSSTVMCGKRLYAWKTMPMSRLLAGTSLMSCRRPAHVPSSATLETGEDPQRRRLPAAGGAEEGDHLPGLDGQVQPVERVHAAVVAGEAVEDDLRAGALARGHARFSFRARRPRPTYDRAISSTDAKSSAAAEAATEVRASLLPSRAMTTWRFS